MTFISVVAPVFNEEENINEFVKQTESVLKQITSEYKIFLIDDGSIDNSWQEIKKLSIINSKITAIKLSRNFGHHKAITAGVQHADSEWVVVMDSDLQDAPKNIIELFEEAKKGYDIVFVSRSDRPISFFYKVSQRLFYFVLNKLSKIKFDYKVANFSIINRKVVYEFNKLSENTRFYSASLNWLGFNTSKIEAPHEKRFKGKPSYKIKNRIDLALDVLVSFSDKPLKMSIYFGFFLSVMSSISLIYILLRKLVFGFEVLGWASVMSIILFFNGIFYLILGIIGFYIGKIYIESMRRPLFIIDEKIN